MQKIMVGLIASVVLMGVIIATLVTGGWGPNGAQTRRHREEVHQLELEAKKEQIALGLMTARQLRPVKTAALGMGLIGTVATLGAVGYYLTMNLRKRSMLIYPGHDGQFPLVKLRTPSGAEIAFDPNRSTTALNVVSEDRQGNVIVMPIIVEQLREDAAVATRQAQAVQLVRAASSGAGLTDDALNAARRFLPNDGGQGIPKVRVLQTSAGPIDKLLEVQEGEQGA